MNPTPYNKTYIGYAAAIGSSLIWGVSPIYFKALSGVPPFEILMHRMVWSFLLLLPILVFLKRWRNWVALLKSKRTMAIFLFTTLLVGSNWFIYIWAVHHNYILQASLGYFIYPLVSVLLGVVFLKERLRPAQTMAVLLAGAGVGYLTLTQGQFPWISLALAFSFAFYALIRKVARAGALEGLTIETLLMFGPALLYLFYQGRQDSGVFLHNGLATDGLLIGTALMTAVPLLLFTTGAKRLPLTSVSFLQYLAPSCHFLIGIFIYHEPFSTTQLVTFVLIWTGLLIFSTDSVRQLKTRQV